MPCFEVVQPFLDSVSRGVNESGAWAGGVLSEIGACHDLTCSVTARCHREIRSGEKL